jgi:histidyl-tRNA synthetase
VMKRGLEWPPASEAESVDLGLRYDLTVPLARFFATHSDELLKPFKSIQTGSVFRAERPQKGRYRQFTQCDIDIIGDDSVAAEAELICATAEALGACGVGEFTVRMNDRRLLDSLVRSAGFSAEDVPTVLVVLDKVDKIGVAGVFEELRASFESDAPRILTEAVEGLVAARGFDDTLMALPSAVDASAVGDLQQIAAVVNATLDWVGMELDTTLVRGQGYYTGSIFEVEHPASSGSLAGGGRYDRMIGKLSGTDAPACGLSIGFERLWDVMASSIDTRAGRRRIALLHSKDDPMDLVATAAHRLREEGDVVRRELAVKNRRAQLTRLSGAGYTHWANYTADAHSIEIQELD